MIKVTLYKLNTKNCFEGVRLELCTRKILVHFDDQTFSICHNEIINYIQKNNMVHLEIRNVKHNLNIVIQPYKTQHANIICTYLDKYYKKKINFTTNPMFL